VDRMVSLGKDGRNDNRGQCQDEIPSGSRGAMGLTWISDSPCNLHLRTD